MTGTSMALLLYEVVSVGCQRGTKAGLVDPPEIVLLAVNERDRDLLAVLALEVRVGPDAALFPGDPELGADAGDHVASLIAEMAAGPA
jgi:hypothetical protein